MKVEVIFFGMLAEKVGLNSTSFEAADTDALNQLILGAHPAIESMSYNIAVNAEMINSNTELKKGDEVAYLPPFAGG